VRNTKIAVAEADLKAAFGNDSAHQFDTRTGYEEVCLPKIPSRTGRSAGAGRIMASSGPMLAVLVSLGVFVLDLFKSRRRLEAENCFCAIS
jgi:hypothetical protein